MIPDITKSGQEGGQQPVWFRYSRFSSLFLDIKKVDLLHHGKVDKALEADHYPRQLLLLTRVEPLVVLVLNCHGFVVWVELSVRRFTTLLPRILTRVIEPPVASEGKSFPL